jgi:hypothetical protein
MNLTNDILQLLKEKSGFDFQLEDDIWQKGMVADDFSDFLAIYAKKYEIDMSEYLWYFHNNEEGTNIGALFFKPPYARVKRIAVTPKILIAFAETKKWNIAYPEHQLPKKRWDIIINQLFFLTFALLIIVLLAMKCS